VLQGVPKRGTYRSTDQIGPIWIRTGNHGKIAKHKWRIYEVHLTYAGRTYEEGKKITWKDGVQALWCIIRYKFTD